MLDHKFNKNIYYFPNISVPSKYPEESDALKL